MRSVDEPRRGPAPGIGSALRHVQGAVLSTRAAFVLLACLCLTLPVLDVTIPPLTDLPGHMGSSAVAAYADDPVFARLMAYRWHPVPNLGTDLVVAALRPALGLLASYRLVAILIPLLLGAGILGVARVLNARGAAATPWALLFVYSAPLSGGFLNYMLGVALALLGLAAWAALDRRPRLREAAAWIAVPLVFLCHVVAGCLLVLFVAVRELEPDWGPGRVVPRPSAATLRRLRPLLSSVAILLAWRLDTRSFAGANRISVGAKLDALLTLLRDQDLALDLGSTLLALAAFVIGWRAGARPPRAVRLTLLALGLLFLVTPSMMSGSSYADARLLPLIPMLAFATQDYGRAARRLARPVMLCGAALLALRLGVTTAGYASYDARYAAELRALPHIAPHSRVLVLNRRDCNALRHWRSDRLNHLGELAIVYRRSWTNSEWDTDGGHLLHILYRPSPRFYDDPSDYVWPDACGGVPARHPTMRDALSALPLDGIDYVWMLDAALPPGFAAPRLSARWHDADSTLYAVLPAEAGIGARP